jgi:hypothetical protein
MSRVRIAATLAVVLSLAVTSIAFAASSKVTGGTSQITATSQAAAVLASNHIAVTALAPATQSGATFTFPIAGGRINPTTFRGVIRSKGGLSISNGTSTFRVRGFTSVSDRHGGWLFALVRRVGARHWQPELFARFTNISVSGGTATATAHLTRASARLLNKLAGRHIVSAGNVIGTSKVSPTLK